MLLIASLPFAVGYFLALGGPSALSAYLAYLNRSDPAGTGPSSGIRPVACSRSCRFTAARCPSWCCRSLGGSYESLREPMGEYLPALSARTAQRPNMPPLSEAQIDSLTQFLLSVLPAALVRLLADHLRH